MTLIWPKTPFYVIFLDFCILFHLNLDKNCKQNKFVREKMIWALFVIYLVSKMALFGRKKFLFWAYFRIYSLFLAEILPKVYTKHVLAEIEF